MLSAGVKPAVYCQELSAEGHILFGENDCRINGCSLLVMATYYLRADANGGKGSSYCHALKGKGLYDPADPWVQPEVT